MTHIVLTEEQARILEQAEGPVEARNSQGRPLARLLPLLASEPEKKQGQPTEWEKWYKQLASCKSLNPGWNGYTAPAPAGQAILLAEQFLDAMRASDLVPTRVAPSAMGGVAVTRKIGARKVLVEFYNDGRVFALFSDRGSDDLPVAEVKGEPGSFSDLIAKMRDFLDG
jgi:hypothetical protein